MTQNASGATSSAREYNNYGILVTTKFITVLSCHKWFGDATLIPHRPLRTAELFGSYKHLPTSKERLNR